MAIREQMSDGERCLVVEAEEDLKAAIMQRDLPFVAPPELARQFGLPDEEEDVGSVEDILPGPDGEGSEYLLPGDPV